jgi:hypothetical protein
MVWGQRKNERVQFERGFNVQIMGIDGSWRRDCLLVDISSSGARLIVSGSIEGLALKEFFLLLAPSGLVHRRCELVRVAADELGVRFLKNDAKKPSRSGTAAAPQN